MPGWGSIVKVVGKGVKTFVPKSIKGWAATYVGYHIVTGKGVDGMAKGLLSEDMQQQVESGEGVLKPVVNGVVGENNIDKLEQKIDTAVEATKAAATSAKESASEAYQAAKQGISDAMNNHSSQPGGQVEIPGGTYPPTYPPTYPQHQQRGNGMLDWFTGNGFNAMNSASLLGAAWLTFGRFSWMGKLMGILLATWGTKNLMNNREQIQAQQQYYSQMYAQQPMNNYQPDLSQKQERPEEDGERYVVRRR